MGEHQQLLSTILWQLWSTWLSPADALVWFSSLLPVCCLPGNLKIYPPFHTLLAMADVLKRYWRREIDIWMIWCPRSLILREKTPEGTDGLTKGAGAGQAWISPFILPCLPSKTLYCHSLSSAYVRRQGKALCASVWFTWNWVFSCLS